ncbi:oligopeptide ABC transporter substrate-binding protein OppA, partial [Vibrio agarivorans]
MHLKAMTFLRIIIRLLIFMAFSIGAEEHKKSSLMKGQGLIRGSGVEVTSLDPHKAQGISDFLVIKDIFEGLLSVDPNGNVVPGVAKSWKNHANKKFIFYLRDDLYWSDGQSITAQDFVYSFQRAVDPQTAAPYSFLFETAKILNAAEIIQGEKSKKELGVKALDNRTLEIILEYPVPHFTNILSNVIFFPVKESLVRQHGDRWSKPENFVGNGPFVLVNRVFNERLELLKNPYYWDSENSLLTKVTYLPIDDQNAELNRFLSGEIHVTSKVPLEDFQRMKTRYPHLMNITDRLCT